MKKIIVAMDGLKYAEEAVGYAIHLARQTDAYIVGVFLDDVLYHSYEIFEMVSKESNVGLMPRMDAMDEKDAILRTEAAGKFKKMCEDANLSCTVHHDKKFALDELLRESIYADLLIINRTETFSNANQASPTSFIKDMLVDVQCPVLLVPNSFEEIEQVLILYDGKPSSVFAIKLFNCMFPSMSTVHTEVLFVKSENDDISFPESGLLKEFIELHIPNASYVVLKGDPQKEIVSYCKEQTPNKMIVLGAYSRSKVSRWFKHSVADGLMQETDCPLFIAYST